MCLKNFYGSTVGKKIIVALTGLFLIFFVVGHMVGNLKTFGGYDSSGVHKLDIYAQFLRSFGHDLLGHATALWIFRILLLGALVLHVVTVIQLQIANKRARGSEYVARKYGAATLSARWMFVGGLFLLLFVVVHLLHLTIGTLHFQGFVEGAVYHNVHSTFQVWYIVLFYILALLALAAHLMHGFWSVFQTLGLNSPTKNIWIKLAARALAVVLLVGFAVVPVAVLVGALPAPKPVSSIEQGK